MVTKPSDTNMPVLAGEEMSEGGAFRCQKCSHYVRVTKGNAVPKCPACGHDIYDRVTSESEN